MDSFWHLRTFGILFLLYGINCQGPPEVNGSFMASGEMVETLEDDSKLLTQMAFEESFDKDTQNAAFRVWILGKNVTFIENFKTNQTFQFNGTDCTLETRESWVKTKSPPNLLAYEETNGTVRFSLKQLFTLGKKNLKEKNVSSVFRGIPARKWMYEIRGVDPEDDKNKQILNVYAYWSDGTWNATSSNKIVPLGFIVTKMIYVSKKKKMMVHEQFINVYNFVHGTFDHRLFEPIQGVQCENRTETLPFPEVNSMQAVALHSELIFPDNLEIRYVDTWLDSKNKLLRMDMERIKDEVPLFMEKARKYQSEIVLGLMEIAFRVTFDKGLFSCEVIPFENFEFDVQNLFNFKLPVKKWEVAKIFGRNETNYVYIGKTHKRDISCYMFQGIRTDWPEPSANVTSLWEWCFSLNVSKTENITFKNGEYNLVHAQTKVLESSNDMFYKGLRMMHHFYDVQQKDPEILNVTNFDISRCFTQTEMRELQFQVNWSIDEDSLQLVENATSDVIFLQKWKNMIYRFSGLKSYTLRVTKVQSTVSDNKLYVKFVLLDPHSKLPSDILKGQISAFEAEKNLRADINKDKVFISYFPNKNAKGMKLYAVASSLEFQVNRTFKPHTLTSLPTTETARTTKFTLKTEPEDDQSTASSTKAVSDSSSGSTAVSDSSSGSTAERITNTDQPVTSPITPPPTKEELNYSGHTPGAVAGISIAMLLVGISVGSAGIFIKFNGLPSCIKPST